MFLYDLTFLYNNKITKAEYKSLILSLTFVKILTQLLLINTHKIDVMALLKTYV